LGVPELVSSAVIFISGSADSTESEEVRALMKDCDFSGESTSLSLTVVRPPTWTVACSTETEAWSAAALSESWSFWGRELMTSTP
jgi:hypothetical protein